MEPRLCLEKRILRILWMIAALAVARKLTASFFESCANSAALLEPSDAVFDDAASVPRTLPESTIVCRRAQNGWNGGEKRR